MKTSTYYHEDDHAMVQLIAEENLPLIWYEFEELIGYDDIERKIDTNAREIFGSNKVKINLKEREIPVNDLENLFLSHGLMPIEEVYTGYGNHSEIDKKTKAFGFFDKNKPTNEFTLFYKQENGIVSLLWFLSRFCKHQTFSNLLHDLGKQWNLCLTVNDAFAVNLKEKKHITHYFNME